MLRRSLVTALAAVALIFSLALAQEKEPPVEKKQVKVKTEAPAATEAKAEGPIMRASELLGVELVNENGEVLGTVEDLVIDNRNAQVQYVIIKTGEDAESYHTVPYRTLSLYRGKDPKDIYFISPVPRERLVQSPPIVRQEWPTWTYTQWNTYVPQVNRYYETVKPIPPRAVRKGKF
jgi:sporulation protein YlmC with PRC-barrel domain